MNELFDKLIIRFSFTFFICFLLLLYRFIHVILYPSAKTQVLKKFYIARNPTDSLHLFGRIIGIGIIFSGQSFYLEDGILFAFMAPFIHGLLSFIMYLSSIWLLENMVLYNFEYNDEILRRENYSYAIISFTISIALSFLIKKVGMISNYSVIVLLFLWPFSIVILGLGTRIYHYLSKLQFKALVLQKDLSVAFSYSGFIFGITLLTITGLDQSFINIQKYIILTLLKLLLSSIIYPLFQIGLIKVFSLQQNSSDSNLTSNKSMYSLGHGLYEGTIFFTAAILTTLVIGSIIFGSFLPPPRSLIRSTNLLTMEFKIFETVDRIANVLGRVEKRINDIEEKLDLSLAISRNHLIRVKNGEEVPDDLILYGRPYNDLPPQKAYEIYQNIDFDFIFIDVSKEDYISPSAIKGISKIPLEEMPSRFGEIQSKITPILLISEKGLRSIQTAELLVKKGFFNVNNISGGHQFWPGHENESIDKNNGSQEV